MTLDPASARLPLDENGVDLSTGEVVAPSSTIAIGGENGLAFAGVTSGPGWRHNWLFSITVDTAPANDVYYIQLGGGSVAFEKVGSAFNALSDESGTLTETATELVYVDASGTEFTFSKSLVANGESYYEAVEAVGTKVTGPNGYAVTLHYRGDSYTPLGAPGTTVYTIRLQSVTNETGYQLKFDYVEDTPSPNTFANDWYKINRVTAVNNAVEPCDPVADSCSFGNPWPSLDYELELVANGSSLEQVHKFTDSLGRQAQVRTDGTNRVIGIKRPGELTDGVAITYDGDDRAASVTHQNSYTRTYTWSLASNELTSVSTDALGRERTVITDLTTGLLMSVEDALGNTTTYNYNADDRLEKVTTPRGNSVEYAYDTRGNVTTVTQKPVVGSVLDPIVSTTAYPVSCSNPVTCNKPTSSTDANGNVTNYTWDPNHGGLLSVEQPSPSPGDPRPTTEVEYDTYRARFYDANGSLTDGDDITLPKETSQCRTAATCDGTANEAQTLISYTNGGAQNLDVLEVTTQAGDGSVSLSTSYTYNERGEVETVDGPLAGSDDTTTYRYDDVGQVTGVIGPDPDGTGIQRHSASRMTYNDDGQVTQSESGDVAGTSETDWAAFTVRTKALTQYDEFGRVEATAQMSLDDTTRYSVVQYGYDLASRPDCTAVRMNLSDATVPLPADVCTQSATTPGPHGEDRITKRYYDAADRVTEVWSAVDTNLAQQSAEISHFNSGTVQWVEDAADNRTTYYRDAFARVYRVVYPDPDNPNTSNFGDDELLFFDASGRVRAFRSRDDLLTRFIYDDLNRIVERDVPARAGLDSTHTLDVHYEYDLLGSLTVARFQGAAANRIEYAYDALGRPISTTQAMDGTSRTVAYAYDAGGRRSRVIHPDGEFWDYEFNTGGALTNLRDGDGFAMVTPEYHEWGGLKKLARNYNAPDEEFFYDNALRLDRISQDHPTNPVHDVNRSATFNPAGQVTTEEIDNQAYVWDGHPTGSLDTVYDADGLNQYDSVNGTAFTYDANGNLTSDGVTTYTYDTENKLVAASGGNNVDLRYDPLGQLYEIEDVNGNITRMLYDGYDLIAEYNGSGAMTKRYVHGLSSGDDPLIEFDGSGAHRNNAKFLYTDRRGSVVSSFSRFAQNLSINSYDEFGVPGPSSGIENTGRFRYTGQLWIPELGAYHYKARAYSPGLGRFLQADPIGYGDGPNMYAYVGNDPVNSMDPSGLFDIRVCGAPRSITRTKTRSVTIDGVTSTGTYDVISEVPNCYMVNVGVLDSIQPSETFTIEGILRQLKELNSDVCRSIFSPTGNERVTADHIAAAIGAGIGTTVSLVVGEKILAYATHRAGAKAGGEIGSRADAGERARVRARRFVRAGGVGGAVVGGLVGSMFADEIDQAGEAIARVLCD
ncbi:MAG: RHS repeat-associated core domain-containing protein [Erythrobacter sp.]